MSKYGRCYKCFGDLTCPECESDIPIHPSILDDLYEIFIKELDGKLTKPEIISLYNNVGSLFV